MLLVVGARPNFMKVAPVIRALTARHHDAILVHTGQHYDAAMSETFFRDLDLPAPHHQLGVGSGTHAWQVARIMETFAPVLEAERPDWVMVVGDVNSTMAAALVTANLRAGLRCRLAHLEAGLRSGDWRMPEEVNRIVTDRVADLLLTPSPDADAHLAAEGVARHRIVFVGNVMVDSLLHALQRARAAHAPADWGLNGGGYVLVTLHRPSNVDDPDALEVVLSGVERLAQRVRVVFPMHPRTADRIRSFGLDARLRDVRVTAPLSYLEMVALLDSSAAVLTDSGGVQEETTVLGVPCVTLREGTERPITIQVGTNRLLPWPPSVESLVRVVDEARREAREPVGTRCPAGWDGWAAERTVDALERAG